MLLLATALAANPVYQHPLGGAPHTLSQPDRPDRVVYRFDSQFYVLNQDQEVLAVENRVGWEQTHEPAGWVSKRVDPRKSEFVEYYPRVDDIPPVVRTRDPGVVLFHDASGLWRWPLKEAPVRIHTEPVSTWTNLDGGPRWTLPVQDSATGDLGSLSGNTLLWHSPEGQLVESWDLPGDPEMPGWWQIFAGPDRRVAVARLTKRGRRLWFRVDGEWRASKGRAFNYIRQNGEWHTNADGEHRLLLSCGKHGATLLDEAGSVLATHRPILSWRRYSRTVFSPDRRQLAQVVSGSSTEQDLLYLLDPEDLSVLARHPLSTAFPDAEQEMAWQDDGIWASPMVGMTTAPLWHRWDGEELPVVSMPGPGRVHRLTQVDSRGVVYLMADGRSMLAPALGALGPVLQIDETGWSVVEPNGTVRCGGAGCSRWRCVEDDRDRVLPITDRACRDWVSGPDFGRTHRKRRRSR